VLSKQVSLLRDSKIFTWELPQNVIIGPRATVIAHDDQQEIWIFSDPTLNNLHVFVELINNLNCMRIIFAVRTTKVRLVPMFKKRKFHLLESFVIKFVDDLCGD
jgi:hypothetical protein